MPSSYQFSLLVLLAAAAVNSKSLPRLHKTLTSPLPSHKPPQNTSLEGTGLWYMTLSAKEQGYVAGGSLVSFDDQLVAEEKADILDTLLYAELSASDVYDKTYNFTQWYRVYVNMLEAIGWHVTSLGFTPYNPSTNSFTVTSAVWKFLAPLCKNVQKQVSPFLSIMHDTCV